MKQKKQKNMQFKKLLLDKYFSEVFIPEVNRKD